MSIYSQHFGERTAVSALSSNTVNFMSTPITDIAGIGPAAAAVLSENGYYSAEDIASTDVESLCSAPGFGPVRASAAIAAAIKITPTKKTSPSKPKKKKKDAKASKKNKVKKQDKKSKSKKKSKTKKSGKKSKKK